ncbi:MAG: hypothetical protein HWN67_22690, partial [Candidatus Helarchaeota archaeon]|nr:hypothetical protein [Candidatus Helarchaeota archaeon]
MKKVLIITYYFPPLGGAGVQRILKFIKYLPDFNWIPLILTVKNADYYIKDHTLMEQVTDRENICYTHAILFGRFFRKIFHHNSEKLENVNRKDNIFLKPIKTIFNFLKKVFYTFVYFPDEYIGWIPFGLIKGYYFIKKKDVDLIISSGPPISVHIIGYFLKKFTGRKWIIDCRDLWETYNYVYNPFNFKFKIKTEEFFESKVFKYADRIVLASPPWVSQLKEKYHEVDKGKFSVITNGFDKDDFKDIESQRFEKEFNIIHSGNMYMWRKPDNFLIAVNNLIKK